MQQTVQDGLQHYRESNAAEKIRKRAAMFSWPNAATAYLNIYRSLY